MTDQAGEQLGSVEAVGAIQEYPQIWSQTDPVNIRLSENAMKQQLSGMARRQEAKSPFHKWWYQTRREMGLNL